MSVTLKELPIEALQEIHLLTIDHSRDWWHVLMKNSGVELFAQMLRETSQAEGVTFDLRVMTDDGSAVPEPVILMMLLRAGTKTLALANAVHDWLAKTCDKPMSDKEKCLRARA